MFSPPVGGRSPTWAVARDSLGGMSNEAMIHEMLYNPGWQLPSGDLEGAWEVAKAALEQDDPVKCLPELNIQELQVRAPPSLFLSIFFPAFSLSLLFPPPSSPPPAPLLSQSYRRLSWLGTAASCPWKLAGARPSGSCSWNAPACRSHCRAGLLGLS